MSLRLRALPPGGFANQAKPACSAAPVLKLHVFRPAFAALLAKHFSTIGTNALHGKLLFCLSHSSGFVIDGRALRKKITQGAAHDAGKVQIILFRVALRLLPQFVIESYGFPMLKILSHAGYPSLSDQ